MTKYTLSLPKHTFKVIISRKRKSSNKVPSLFSELKELSNIRSGNKLSRVVRIVSDRTNVRAILGGNIAFMVLSASLLVPTGSLLTQAQLAEPAETTILTAEQKLTTDVVVHYPFKNPKLNQSYSFFHPALDLGGPTGEPLYPIENGVVETVESSRYGYGNSVVVDHQNGLKSRYAHLSKIKVEQGEDVNTKTTIGTLGSTGHSTGPHLHLEVYKDGKNINPQTVLGAIK